MSTTTTRHARSWDQQRSWPALLVILCLHAAGLWGLMQIEAVREAVQDITPIMVGMITVPQPEPPKPVMEPPPPTPVPDRPKPKPQMIAAQTPAPAAITAPPPEPVMVEAPPPPPAAAAEPAPVIPPNFVAAYLDNPPPAYPLSSKRLGETGTVLLRVRVSEMGRAESVELERSSGFARLDRAAIDAVRQWKFVPAKQADVAVPAYVLIPLNFDLSSS
ncbi:MAG: energy transducer TonB [Panacagrimonas sp.]